MTTEAEEFKKQENRFDKLAQRFCDVWGSCLTFKIVRYDSGSYAAEAYLINDRLFIETDGEGGILQALRALNDRLERALQGKVKGE